MLRVHAQLRAVQLAKAEILVSRKVLELGYVTVRACRKNAQFKPWRSANVVCDNPFNAHVHTIELH